MNIRPTSIRGRLTLWYSLSLTMMLLLFAFGTYLFVRSNLLNQTYAKLNNEFSIIEKTLKEHQDELIEVESHAVVNLFHISEADWVIYASGGWAIADLDDSLKMSTTGHRIWDASGNQQFILRQGEVKANGRTYILTVAENITEIFRSLEEMATTLLITFPIGLLASLIGGYWLAGKFLMPFKRMATKAKAISAENLSERLEISNPNDESGHLATVLNTTFARLQEAFDRVSQFSADASHELRTPLAVMRSVGEVGMQRGHNDDYYLNVIGSMLEEADRLTQMVDNLLLLTRTDKQYLAPNCEVTEVGALCGEVVDCLNVLVEETNKKITVKQKTELYVNVDRTTVRQALMNLITNAIRYIPDNGNILVNIACKDKDQVSIEVVDNGIGIAYEHQSKIFQRFYRVDSQKTAGTGNGLGLTIAQWAIEFNGGKLELDSTIKKGSTFRILLPLYSKKVIVKI